MVVVLKEISAVVCVEKLWPNIFNDKRSCLLGNSGMDETERVIIYEKESSLFIGFFPHDLA